MKNLKDLKGCGTALVTPFQEDGSLDLKSLRRLVDFEIGDGIDFLVPCGTTGENATLSFEEHIEVVKTVCDQNKGRVPVIAGAGGNCTAKVIELARAVERTGADAILSVAPYYNKPSQEGLYRHFQAIAGAVSLPVIVYNVPGRTSSNILPDTVARLAGIDNIIGIKEASGNISQMGELAVRIPEGFKMLSGDDANTLPLIALGGQGLISVASNEIPGVMAEFTRLCMENRYPEAMRIQKKYLPLWTGNFLDTNPVPVKAVLAMMGMVKEVYRLPLVPMKESSRKILEGIVRDLGLIK
ncbi:4-hydroxy-tetrahydrodipicolinate synthase [bacterium]|nr:4-hydroxy-tetrahydrodipicolinate synthase [bacterium]